MRIAYFCTEYPPLIYGGLGVYVDNISRHLAALGHDVTVFSWGQIGLSRHELVGGVEVFRETPVPLQDSLEIFLSGETLSWGDGLRYLLDLFSYNQISAADFFLEGPYDLAVSHDWLGLPAGLSAKKKGQTMIYHVHGLEIGRSDRPNPQLVALERKGAQLADLVITVSHAMKQQLQLMDIPHQKIRVCYHGVDTEFFDMQRADPERLDALRKMYGYKSDDLIILFMGRLEPVKGVLQLFSAMSNVLAEYPRVKLLVVGKGSLEDWAHREADRLNCITLVTDFLDANEKMHHYALADLCVFPSIYEPFGIVALEAAAMGKPAVVGASGTSGLGEIVQNPGTKEPTGVHVNARDPGDLAWGIKFALSNTERLKVWGRNARQRALSEFSWRKAAERTIKIYKEAIG